MGLVAYYRVSTTKQGSSGLGLEGQQEAVRRYAMAMGLAIVATFTEIESGKRNDRPQLEAALTHARRTRSSLVVAKLDRLSRNVAFLAKLMESSVEFVACDNPNANRLTLHILAAIAEHEARMISERTKSALAAYKARGGVLGGRRSNHTTLSPEVALRGSQTACRERRERSLLEYAEETRIACELKSEGLSLGQIADRLNSLGHKTVSGAEFCKVKIHRLLKRAGK